MTTLNKELSRSDLMKVNVWIPSIKTNMLKLKNNKQKAK